MIPLSTVVLLRHDSITQPCYNWLYFCSKGLSLSNCHQDKKKYIITVTSPRLKSIYYWWFMVIDSEVLTLLLSIRVIIAFTGNSVLGSLGRHPVHTPLDPGFVITEGDIPEQPDAKLMEFRSLIGSIGYWSTTLQYDINYVVGQLWVPWADIWVGHVKAWRQWIPLGD